ncbi:TPA: Catalyzes the hydrolysis of D-tyrosyl-tRNA(Tyr) [Trebouxia sp. C0004]
MRLFDAHCHLQDPRITHCLEDTLNATEVQGVQQFACNGTSEDDWPQGRSDKWLDNLRKQLEEVPQAGLGECGLDTSKKVQTPIHEQEEVFKAQLELGKELQRPISVHCVSAFGKLHDMVQHHGPFPQGLILHSWIGPAEMVDALAKIKGVYFSLSGHLTRMSKKKYLWRGCCWRQMHQMVGHAWETHTRNGC